MSEPIYLLKDERNNGRERLVARWVQSDGWHRLEVGIERREGGEWKRGYYVSLEAGEVFRLHDAVGMATWLARQVPR